MNAIDARQREAAARSKDKMNDDTFFYYVPGSISPEYACEIQCKWSRHPADVAEEAAEDFHDNHDGGERDWPLVFVVLDSEKNELGRFSVEREYEPIFYARGVAK